MGFEIIWSPKADQNFAAIINYLEINWTKKEIKNFIIRTNSVLLLLSESPNLYKSSSSRKQIREVVLTKHNILIYQIEKETVKILAIFDTRQHPLKKRI